ncbi:MAG: hypothetical protein HQL42_17505 [Alphaproteobacteria bacterium]|nr:hypothetical protein [Alphaproteobacteria bacterium]
MDDRLVRRITPLTVLETIDGEIAAWRQLGCEINGGGDDGNVVGISTGSTHWLVVSRANIAHAFGSFAAERLLGQTIAYVYVANIAHFLESWPDARVIQWGDTAHAGTREVLIAHRGRTMIVAEMIENGA